MLKSDEKVLVSKELVQQFEEINRALNKCCDLAVQQPIPNKQFALMTDASFGAAGYAVLIEDDPNQKFTSLRKSYAPVAYGSKTFTPAQIKMLIYAKEFLAIYFAFKEFGHIFWGAPKPVIILTDNKAVTRFFQTKILPPTLWNACDYVIQFNFVIAHIPGAQNTAADYLSRLEADPKIREDVQTLPIEINVQSAAVSQEEQIFYTNDEDETEEQYWARKEAIRKNPTTDEPTVSIQTLSANLVKHEPDIQVRLRKTNQVLIEQSKDAVLQQLKAKLPDEEYSENILQQDARYRHYANNLERIVLKDEILTRQYFDETGNVKYHQLLLPQHLLRELLQSLHGTAHKHPGISKMLQEIRQRYYYSSMAKHVKKWVEGCEQCARDKRVPNATITSELLNLPDWDLGPEDAMQIDLLPNLPPSSGYENVLTAIDVFSRYLFAYPLMDASAINVAKALIDIMTKHAYLPTTLITDKGTAFTSTIIAEITQILGITLKCATTKHPQTIGKLERTHASLKTNLKMACGEYRRQWHKYLPLAVLNHNTSYHDSIGCEPTRVFHGRIPFNILDHKLGNNPNEQINPTTEIAEEIQNRTKILIDKTKQNIMQSYIKYKEYYDRKAKAAPLKENDHCFVLQPKADNQGSKIPFREYRWVGPFVVQKVLPNDNYIVRRINTNKTQILHRIRLKKFIPNQPLEDNFREQRLQPDEEIVIPQDDLYVITWETDFGGQLTAREHDPIPTSLPIGERPSAAQPNSNDAHENEVVYIITRDDPNYDDHTMQSRNGRLNDDVTTRNETSEAPRNEESDWPNPAVSPKSQKKSLPNTADRPENDEIFSERNSMNENDVQTSPKRGDDIIVPEISENDARNERLSPRGGKYNLRPNPNPNYSEDFRY